MTKASHGSVVGGANDGVANDAAATPTQSAKRMNKFELPAELGTVYRKARERP
jgi:hypothetical protein